MYKFAKSTSYFHQKEADFGIFRPSRKELNVPKLRSSKVK